MLYHDSFKRHFYFCRGVDRSKIPVRCREVSRVEMERVVGKKFGYLFFDLSEYCIYDPKEEVIVEHGIATRVLCKYKIKKLENSRLTVRQQCDIVDKLPYGDW